MKRKIAVNIFSTTMTDNQKFYQDCQNKTSGKAVRSPPQRLYRCTKNSFEKKKCNDSFTHYKSLDKTNNEPLANAKNGLPTVSKYLIEP